MSHDSASIPPRAADGFMTGGTPATPLQAASQSASASQLASKSAPQSAATSPGRASAPSSLAHSLHAGVAAARQWRLLLLWALLSLLPTALLTVPAWQLLGANLDFSVHAPAMASELDMVALSDLYHSAMRGGGAALPVSALLALVLTLLLSPFLTGMAMSAARAEGTPGFAALIGGGVQEYARMARMLVVALLPLLGATLLGGLARGMADRQGEVAVQASAAAQAGMAATLVMALLLLLAHASVDAGRAVLALDRRRRSACLAWWQGVRLLARHPLRTLGVYLPVTLVALAVAALLALGRLHLPPVDSVGVVTALLLTQAVVLVLAWMRTARLFAMIGLVRNNGR